MAKRWTEDEDIYLEYFIFEKDSKLQDAADYLGRSLSAVITRATIIRNKRKDYYIRRKWTPEEDEYIKTHYRTQTYQMISRRLGRSVKSLGERVRYLGLRKNNSLVALDGVIREMAGSGAYTVDIARNLNLDYETLREYLNRNDISYQVMSAEESLKKAREASPYRKLEEARYSQIVYRKNSK